MFFFNYFYVAFINCLHGYSIDIMFNDLDMEYQGKGTQYTDFLAVYPINFLCKPKFRSHFTIINSRSADFRCFSNDNGGNTNGENSEERFYIRNVDKRQRQCAKTAPHFAFEHDINICTLSLFIFVNSLYRKVYVTVCVLFQISIKNKCNFLCFISFMFLNIEMNFKLGSNEKKTTTTYKKRHWRKEKK